MFTGIITDVGQVLTVVPGADDRDLRIRIGTRLDLSDLAAGASIACSGICLTAIAYGSDWFDVDLSAETLACTNAGAWMPGRPINLERALRVGDELGGHILSGHVDGLAEILSVVPEGGSTRWRFALPDDLVALVAPKGSVALDGVSLTVNEVEGRCFGVNLIPHTQLHTSFGHARPGDRVNVEIDMLARYVARQLARTGVPVQER